jgi:hypothetical protein
MFVLITHGKQPDVPQVSKTLFDYVLCSPPSVGLYKIRTKKDIKIVDFKINKGRHTKTKMITINKHEALSRKRNYMYAD